MVNPAPLRPTSEPSEPKTPSWVFGSPTCNNRPKWCGVNTKIIRFFIWSAAVIFLMALAARDLQLDRTIDVAVDKFDRATPYVSTFGPNARVERSGDAVRVVGEPVYVNVRLPRWFKRATIELAYENPTGLSAIALGVRTHPTLWQFEFPQPEEAHPLMLPLPSLANSGSRPARGGGERSNSPIQEFPPLPTGGGVRGGGASAEPQVIRIPFELQRGWQVERNVYQFILSTPGASTERPLIIRAFRVIAERDPICLGRLCI
ncbi:MAG: hypothetical protein V1723_03400 [Candidatus Uhrbacteria bacterium]